MKKEHIEKLDAILKKLDEVQEEMDALKGEVEQVTDGYDDYDRDYDELLHYLDESCFQHEGVIYDLRDVRGSLNEDDN